MPLALDQTERRGVIQYSAAVCDYQRAVDTVEAFPRSAQSAQHLLTVAARLKEMQHYVGIEFIPNANIDRRRRQAHEVLGMTAAREYLEKYDAA